MWGQGEPSIGTQGVMLQLVMNKLLHHVAVLLHHRAHLPLHRDTGPATTGRR